MKKLLLIFLALIIFIPAICYAGNLHHYYMKIAKSRVSGGEPSPPAPAADNVWFSASVETIDLKTGSPDITIATEAAYSIATLTVAQTGNIGVGDEITYDTSKKAYISSISDSTPTKFTILTATGGVPTVEASGVTVNSIKHAFASLNAAEAAIDGASFLNTKDLTSISKQLNVVLYYDSAGFAADTTSADWDGWITGATNLLNIYTPQGGTASVNSQRHVGAWDTNKHWFSFTNDFGIRIREDFARIDGIQILVIHTGTSSATGITHVGITGATTDLRYSNMIINGGGIGGTGGTFTGMEVSDADIEVAISNTIFYDFIGSGVNGKGADTRTNTTCDIYNSVFAGSVRGINLASTTTLTNCAVFNNTDDVDGTPNAITYCIGDDAEFDSGTGNVGMDGTSTDWDAAYTDYSTNDYTVVTSGLADDAGTNNPSGSGFGDPDIAGTAREGTWDIGAFEN